MPTSHRPRHGACTRCGDTVLIAERTAKVLFGRKVGKGAEVWLEHADPGPDGEVFDCVDDACRRPPVR